MPWLLALSPALHAATLNDAEIGVRLEVPAWSSAPVDEVGLGLGAGDSKIHLGAQVDLAYSFTDRFQGLAYVGTRRGFLEYQAPEDVDTVNASIQTSALRIGLGAKYSLLNPPTFLYVSSGVYFCSNAWLLQIGAGNGDRKSVGVGEFVAIGVDHFLRPSTIVGIELRPWAEHYKGETMALDPWRFEGSSGRYGVSVLVGVAFR